MTKNKYDSSVIFLYAIGKEALLPAEFRKQIPYSTISTWRQTNYSKYLGHEFRYFFDESFDKAVMANQFVELKKTVLAFARSWGWLSFVLKPLIKKASKDRALKQKIVRAVNSMSDHVGLESALRIVGLSRTLFQNWVLEAKFSCFDSFTQLCVRRHPQQMTLKEIIKMQKILTDPQSKHWPIMAIGADALRKKKLIVCQTTLYKYARLLNITKKAPGKRRKTKGLIATMPNEYIHGDTTHFELSNGKAIYIHFIMDNYSKMILGYHVGERNNFALVTRSLKNALKTIMRHPHQKPDSLAGGHSFLVADGGKEYHNNNVENFISRLSDHKITKITALKDIRFSNAPVEAVHRTMKGRYLYDKKFRTIKELRIYLKWAVQDYNAIRPHYKHMPRTPQEVYFNIPLGFDLKKRIKNAIKKRILKNKCANCIQCTGDCKTRKYRVFTTGIKPLELE